MRTFALLLSIASTTSTQGSFLLVDGFSTTTATTSPLHHQSNNANAAVPASPSTLWALGPHMTSNTHLMRHRHVHIDDDNYDDDDDEVDDQQSFPSGSSSSSSSPLPAFSQKKTELRLDGLEPYVVVSAITSTTSFGVVTGGNLFSDSSFFSVSDSMFQELLRILLVVNSMASSCLGLYSLGIFSFTIMYCKAALARQDRSLELYQDFFDDTASFRYKGYRAFVLSLILLVADLFLFGLAYLPEYVQPLAALGSAPVIFAIWKDWQAIISKASVIYAPPPQEVDSVVVEEEEEANSPVAVNEAEKERMEQNGMVTLMLDKAIGVLTTSL